MKKTLIEHSNLANSLQFELSQTKNAFITL